MEASITRLSSLARGYQSFGGFDALGEDGPIAIPGVLAYTLATGKTVYLPAEWNSMSAVQKLLFIQASNLSADDAMQLETEAGIDDTSIAQQAAQEAITNVNAIEAAQRAVSRVNAIMFGAGTIGDGIRTMPINLGTGARQGNPNDNTPPKKDEGFKLPSLNTLAVALGLSVGATSLVLLAGGTVALIVATRK